MDNMHVLTPDPSALAEVVAVHEQLDPPEQPLVLASTIEMSTIYVDQPEE